MDARSGDFETYSVLELPKVGVDVYAEHPSTGIYCLSYEHADKSIGRYFFDPPDPRVAVMPVWAEFSKEPTAFLDYLENGGTLRGWNCAFEAVIWNRVIARLKPHWPRLRPEQFECTMARAYAQALPGKLEWCAEAMNLTEKKDEAGNKIMRRMCAPTLKWRRNPVGPPIYDVRPGDFEKLGAYCDQDVRCEAEAASKLAPLSARERKVWLLDQKINRRGAQIDVAAVTVADEIVNEEIKNLNTELRFLTNSAVSAVTAPAQIRAWVNQQGVTADNLRKDTLATLLASDLAAGPARRALEIRAEGGKASVKKLRAMLAGANTDGRARGLYGYHIATTGRWAGFRSQPQNLPRPDIDQDEIEQVIDLLGAPEPAECIRMNHGAPLGRLSSCLRAMFVPAPGHTFIAGDFANIEGRGVAWLAGEKAKLDAFRAQDAKTGPDVYKVAYSRSFGIKPDDVSSTQRQIGKVQELALGYQGGPAAFISMAANYNLHIPTICEMTIKAAGEETFNAFWFEMLKHERTPQQYGMLKDKLDFSQWCALKYIVTKWRLAHPNIVSFWYDLQRAAIDAVLQPGSQFVTESGSIRFIKSGQMLFCQLPSRRCLAYPYPSLVYERDEIAAKKAADEGREYKPKPSLEYMAWDGIKKKWLPARSYGGHLAENATQGAARDAQADAMLRCEDEGLSTVLHTHDSICAEVKTGSKTPEDLRRIMCASEPWLRGLPVAADVAESKRYGK